MDLEISNCSLALITNEKLVTLNACACLRLYKSSSKFACFDSNNSEKRYGGQSWPQCILSLVLSPFSHSSSHSSPHHALSMGWNWTGASGMQCWTGNDGIA